MTDFSSGPESAPQRFRTPDLVVRETGRFVPEQQAYLQLVHTANVFGAELAAVFAAHGLSGKQYNALRAMRRAGADGLTVNEVAEQMTERGADVTRLIDRLVRDGLVERRADARDRRVVRVALTAEGVARLAGLDGPLLETHRRQLGHLSEAETATLIALLKKARREEEFSDSAAENKRSLTADPAR